MANLNAPSGLSPVSYLNGAKWNGQARVYWVDHTTEANALAIGDPVASSGDADANGVPGVTLATAGHAPNMLRGVIIGMGGTVFGGPGGDPASPQTTVMPATKTKDYYVMVCDDPFVIFEVQEDSVGGNIAAASVGLNCDLIAGTNNGYVSGWMLDSSSVNALATYQCRILGLAPRSGNAIGNYAKWLVRINQHELFAGVAGV